MRRVADAVMGALAAVLVHIFFRRVELEHGEAVVPGVPTVLVANHTNGLVDALLLMAALRRYPRFLGKSTLFKIVPVWPFLKLAGVVPVYRAKDGESTSKNTEAFAMCRRLLAYGAMVAVFPVGISYDEPSLQPLKTGAARIALGAALDDHVEGVVTVAVGLAYDSKARFRSRALVRVGGPQPVALWADGYQRDDHEATRQLTDDIARRLRQVSPDYESWSRRSVSPTSPRWWVAPPGSCRPRWTACGPDSWPGLWPTRTATLSAQVRRPRCSRLNTPTRATSSCSGSATPTWPPATVRAVSGSCSCGRWPRSSSRHPSPRWGRVVHAVPYQIMKRVGMLPQNEGIKATVKLLGCFALFTLLYVALAVVFGTQFGLAAGIAAFVAAPACGYVTVLFSERVKRVGGAVAGARTVKSRRAALESVLAHRHAVVERGGGVVDSANL